MNKKMSIFVWITAIVVILDQITKYIVQDFNIQIGSGILKIHTITNSGAAFGLFKSQGMLLIIFSMIVLGVILYYYKKTPEKMIPFTALLFAGALGNLIDRLWHGFVIDFIDFSFWPAFNVADMAITASVIGLIYLIYKE